VATPTLSVGAPTVSEGDVAARNAVVPVTLSEPAPAPVSVVFESDGTLPEDWQDLTCEELNRARVEPLTTTVSFTTGQQSKQVNVPVNGNVLADNLSTGVSSKVTLVSGQAILDQPDPMVIVDDENAAGVTSPAPPPPGTYRVSELPDGSDPTFPPAVAHTELGCGYPQSIRSSVTADGRYVLFTSNADNLVSDDANGVDDVFVKDTWTGAIERVNVAADGTQANGGWSRAESISADGRYVTFLSTASNLVPDDDNEFLDSFVKDRVSGAVERLGNIHTFHGASMQSFIGGDNRSVVFTTDAPLNGGSCTGCDRVYLYDVITGAYTPVSDGAGITFDSAGHAVISGDGQHVAFLGWIATEYQVYVKDLDTGNVEMVSVNNAGEPTSGYGTYALNRPAISDDGQVVAFAGEYCNTGLPAWRCANADPGHYGVEIWVRDRTAGTLTLGSVGPTGHPATESHDEVSLSADGRYLAFTAAETPWAPECPQSGPSSGGDFVWLRDLSAGTTERVNTDVDGDPCTSATLWSPQSLTPDASSIVYVAMHDGNVSTTNPEVVYITRRN
jgi:Tol biopolymer transport system component